MDKQEKPTHRERWLSASVHTWILLWSIEPLLGVLAFGLPIGLLVFYGDSSVHMSVHSRQALNAQFSYLAYGLGAGLLSAITLGLGAIPVIIVFAGFWLMMLVASVLAFLAGVHGHHFSYPLALQLF